MSDAVALKDKGNAAFAKKDYENAIQFFTEAIKLDASNHVLYSNRAASYTALGLKDASNLDLAIQDALKCIELKPDFAKGYSRHATALSAKKDYAAAVKAYAAGIAHAPTDSLLVDGLAQAQKMLQTLSLDGSSSSSSSDDVDEHKETEDVVIGIDLGTTYSCVGVWENDTVKMIPNDRGAITTPSYVTFNDTGKRFVGIAAKNMASQFPKTCLFDVKRIIGKRYEDEGVDADCKHFPFRVVPSEGEAGKNGHGKPLIEVNLGGQGIKRFAPEEVSAMVLGYLKRCAETHLKRPVTKAVITVPAYFNDAQRTATKNAGKIAGLDVLRIINEPTAAALSYGLDRANKEEKMNVLIFDLGGGTFDVSILTIEGGLTEVKATGGDTRLGGEDLDQTTVNFLLGVADEMKMPTIVNDERAMLRLKQAAEQAKRQLSSSTEAEIFLEGLFTLEEAKASNNNNQKSKKLDFRYTLTRADFERINMHWFTKCLETVRRVLKDAKMKHNDIGEIVLVGGSTRTPKIQEMLREEFGGKELCKSLNPDEAVAYGAAVQGAILNGKRNKQTSDLLLMDVTPLSLGIETVGRVMSVVIPRNTPIPCVRSSIYTTEENYQTAVDVSVFEGERSKTSENNELGHFTITGIERAKRGEPKIEVTFAIDSNGILNVTAYDLKTKSKASVEIDSRERASDEDIARMIADAEKFKHEDEEQAKRIEAVNNLEHIIAEMMERADEITNAKNREQLVKAAEDLQNWVDQNGEEARVIEVQKRIRAAESTIQKYFK